MRLTYEYMNLSQVFHFSNYPQEWTPALDIVMSAAGRKPRPAETEEFALVLAGQARGEIWTEDSVPPASVFFSVLRRIRVFPLGTCGHILCEFAWLLHCTCA